MLVALSIFSYILILGLLAALAWRDVQEYILPNKLNAALALAFVAFHISIGWRLITPLESLSGGLVGGGFLLAIAFIADKFYRKDSIGMGDVKLMAVAGLGLGFPQVLLAMSAGAFAGLFHGCMIALWRQKKTKQSVSLHEINVPAGLGLCVGIAIIMVTQFGFSWIGS